MHMYNMGTCNLENKIITLTYIVFIPVVVTKGTRTLLIRARERRKLKRMDFQNTTKISSSVTFRNISMHWQTNRTQCLEY